VVLVLAILAGFLSTAGASMSRTTCHRRRAA
jgi:hypothetical protein